MRWSHGSWCDDGVDVLSVVSSEVCHLVTMRDRFDLSVKSLSAPDGSVTYRRLRVSTCPTYWNWVRYVVGNDCEDVSV